MYGALSEELVETAMEDKDLILIGINEYNLDDKKEGASILNHEEFHGTTTLDGDESMDKNKDDHGRYYGEKREDSPTTSKVRTEPKYSNSLAKQQLDEIDAIIDEDEN